MADVSISTITHFLKGQFKKGAVEEEVLLASRSPLYQLMQKDTGFGGEYLKIPVIYGLLPSGSSSFAVAQTNKGGLQGVAFKIEGDDLREDYTVFGITGKTLRVASKDVHAFFNQLDRLVRAAYQTQARRRAARLYRRYTGSIGQLSSTASVATTTMTWAYRGMARLVEKGHRLVFSGTDGGALRDSGEVLAITAMNRGATTATATVDPSMATIAGIAVSDYIYFEGDWNDCMHGLLDWVPVTDPSPSEDYFNVDRSVDRQRLAGTAMDCSGIDILSALIEAVALASENGPAELYAFLPPESYRKAKELIRGSTHYVMEPVTESAIMSNGAKSQTVSVRGFSIDGDNGVVKVFSDPWCPPTYGFVVELPRFTLHSAGEDPGILMEDGQKILREASADGYEGRVGGYHEMSCDGPGSCITMYNLI